MKFSRVFGLGLMGFTLILSTPVAAEDEEVPTTYAFKSLSLELASRAAWGAIAECRRQGFSVAVAVVDRGGNLQASLRDRFAGAHTPDTAFRKAWTSASFRQNTGDLAQLLKEGRVPSQVQHVTGALLLGGGVMIQDGGGVLLGAIGVSGAPPGKSEQDSIDGACGLAGIAAIEEPLSFGD